MTIGNTPKRAKRAYAAPRRRFRSDDDAGYLGDAPILLNLPNLCGVPDLDDEEEQDPPLPYEADADSVNSLSSASASTVEPEPAAAADIATASEEIPAAVTESSESAEWIRETEEDSDSTDEHPKEETKLAAPEFTPSGAPTDPSESHTADDAEDDDVDDEFDDDYEEDYDDEIASGPSVHRKIITWTAIFVAVASLYMYVNRNQAQPVATPTDQPDVELGWEEDPFLNESYGTEAPMLEPAYGDQFDVPLDPADPMQATTDTQPTMATQPAPEATVGDRLPGESEATSGWQFQRVRSRGQESGYPETTTPEAAYEVTNNPTDIRTSMRTDAAGPTSSLDGISPMTPTAGAANDQPY